MITLSVCLIVKNEEAVLARCLESAKQIADEMIVVDTGSTDGTKEIARQYTNKVYDFPWIDDFSAARNFSFSKGEMEYLMWLDADDVLLEEDIRAILELKKSLPPETDVVMMKYHAAFDKAGAPTFSYYRERILRNSEKALWQGAIHEVIAPWGNILYSEIAVTHKKEGPGDPDRNLRIFESMLEQGKTLSAREQFYFARELYYHARYEEAAAAFKTFIDSGLGWIENVIEACRLRAECLLNLKNEKEAVLSYFETFQFDVPRAETCCDLGKYFLGRAKLNQAVFWYKQALESPRDDQKGGFVLVDCYGFLPYLQLAVCYDKLKNYPLAREYNEKAGKLKPNDPSYLYNKKYFDELFKKFPPT